MLYPTDVRDKEWGQIKEFFEQKRKFGRPLSHNRRDMVNAILYITKTGCQWRMLPNDFPPWTTVYYYFQKWSKEGKWEQVLDLLNKRDRIRQGRTPDPSFGIIDSQSVKTQYNSDERGIDGGKKVKGRKRHIVTDVEGHLLYVKVHAANIHDTKAAPSVLDAVKEKAPTLEGFSADEGYRGTTVEHVEKKMQLIIEISKKIKDGWAILAKRWVVERTIAWINNSRSLSKDFEILTCSSENFIRIAMIQIMLDRVMLNTFQTGSYCKNPTLPV